MASSASFEAPFTIVVSSTVCGVFITTASFRKRSGTNSQREVNDWQLNVLALQGNLDFDIKLYTPTSILSVRKAFWRYLVSLVKELILPSVVQL